MTYYHGGVPGLVLGASILPPSRTGCRDSAKAIVTEYGMDGGHVRDDVVFLGTLEIAELFAAMYPDVAGGWVYEVDPVGLVAPDPDYHGPDPDESVQCPSAVIVRVVGPLSREYVAMVRRVMLDGAA